MSVADRLHAYRLVRGSAEEKREERERLDLPINALGSGSVYTPFLQHLGVASLDIRYGGEGVNDGVYHSVYDSFDHYTRFGDPNFDYGIALAQTAGRAVLRLANGDPANGSTAVLGAETIDNKEGFAPGRVSA